MRLLVDLLSHTSGSPEIIQAQRVPQEGSAGAEPINGKYVIPVPLDMDFPVGTTDYVLNAGVIDGGDVASRSYAHLLALYPQFGTVYFNPLLTADHVDELVLDQSFWFVDRSADPPNNFYVRCQTGRETSAISDIGQMPTHTALLPVNSGTTPDRPGLIITDEIDLGPYTLDCNDQPVGTDEFMVYWKLYDFTETHDIAADAGALAGTNEPSLRMLEETDQEPAGFSAWLTTDNGANWCQVGLLEPIAFCDKSTRVRLAFRNDSTSKVFLASYALLF